MKLNPNKQFELLWVSLGGQTLIREYRFCATRRFRFDYYHDNGVAIEIEGGIWTKGRHTRGAGYIKDMEKYNLAAQRRILVFRIPAHKITTEWLRPIISTINYGGSMMHYNLIKTITKGKNK
jgi:hypothetical protein